LNACVADVDEADRREAVEEMMRRVAVRMAVLDIIIVVLVSYGMVW